MIGLSWGKQNLTAVCTNYISLVFDFLTCTVNFGPTCEVSQVSRTRLNGTVKTNEWKLTANPRNGKHGIHFKTCELIKNKLNHYILLKALKTKPGNVFIDIAQCNSKLTSTWKISSGSNKSNLVSKILYLNFTIYLP